MQPDTRKIFRTGIGIFGTGLIAALLMETFLGGVTRQGPHTNLGWLALMVAMGCFPPASSLCCSPPPSSTATAQNKHTREAPQARTQRLGIHHHRLCALCGFLRALCVSAFAFSNPYSFIPRPCLSAILTFTRRASMAKGVNKVMLLGNVGKDPEIRTTAGGMTVASFSLATADRAKDAAGQLGRQDRVAQPRLLPAHRRNRPRLRQEGLAALRRRQDPDALLGRQDLRRKEVQD